jgi:hypothetical protein
MTALRMVPIMPGAGRMNKKILIVPHAIAVPAKCINFLPIAGILKN